ncbi:polymorphic toxin type 15 domain-containing protein [Chromobacterium alticapitis]|uniref:Novel toxin 15 domain-containing protein n=1 Tax=Chromobacterium alticapitis TaxID=2073169 RepID=A0A2S5DAB5_9NEIS|nr:polymorphic toxin type 15 domain-containing protein [Chromobacterium alticapitis]POZ59988.1 hypothetical protein C2I19_21300 [Chromobacterium alticapitis]
MRKLAGQEAGLNKLTAGEIRSNIEQFRANGRPSDASNEIMQFRNANPVVEDPFVQSYLDRIGAEGQPRFAALHEPDMVIGGRPDMVTGYGDLRVNSSLGSQNRYFQDAIYQATLGVPKNSYVRFKFGAISQ